MTEVDYKECTKCNNVLPLDCFQSNRNSADNRDSKCKTCKNDYLSQWRMEKFKEDPSKHLLLNSVSNCYYRGQPSYTKSPYQNVNCEWDSASDFFDYLWNDYEWMARWNAQTEKYIESGKKEDRPSINRIDSNRGYVKGNIEVQSLGDNIREGSSHPCELYLIPEGNLRNSEMIEFGSKEELKKYLIDTSVPVNVLKTLDEGKIHSASNELRFLIQSKDGSLKSHNAPLYELVLDYKRYLVDRQTGNEYLINDETHRFQTGGIRINHN